MHEMSITQEIIAICQRHAGNRQVRYLEVEIGELSGVVPESIEFCFEACSIGTLLEGATLNIIRIPAIGYCQKCNSRTPMSSTYGTCANCGSYQVVIESGEEMRVREIEVDD
jgi:hydrogenase nickel incorporation protein HypA/HybF